MRNVLTIEPETHERFKALCKRLGLKMGAVSDRLIRDWIKRHERQRTLKVAG